MYLSFIILRKSAKPVRRRKQNGMDYRNSVRLLLVGMEERQKQSGDSRKNLEGIKHSYICLSSWCGNHVDYHVR